MNICGIVCEFNPFHNGHRYLIDVSRARLGADSAVVCAMSGDFVQRGEAAAFLKHDRAHAAVVSGADLVLELPLPWCMAPAQTFARGAVGLLGATGVVTHLCFGSECGDLSALQRTARALADPELDALLRAELERGSGYAAARQRALETLTGEEQTALTQPNDILAVEYLNALKAQGLDMTPVCVQRRGAGHDSAEDGAALSAFALRRRMRRGEDVSAQMPEGAYAALMSGAGLLDADRIETALLSRLRALPPEAYACAPDVSEGLENRIYAAARTEATLEAVTDEVSTKRYPRARVRRILISAALGVRKADSAGIPPYLRPLAANGRGLALLREMAERASLPVLTKSAHVRDMGERAERVFTLTAAAEDLCVLGTGRIEDRRGDRDWRSAPVIVD